MSLHVRANLEKYLLHLQAFGRSDRPFFGGLKALKRESDPAMYRGVTFV
jgi:hypothetical protein